MAISSNLAKFRKAGDTIDYKPGTATPAGTIVRVGGVFGLALWDIAANEASTLKVLQRGEVIEVTTDDALGSTNAGVAIYIVDATGLVSKTSTNATCLGYTRAAVGSTDLTFEVVCS
jgi:predicted RecA/RadA family phage recombinase